MKKNKTILLITISACSLVFVFYTLNKMQNLKHVHNTLMDVYSDLQRKEEFYYHNYKLGYRMDGLSADISYIDYSHSKNISELSKNKSVLVCMYKITCRACGKDELNEMYDVFKDYSEAVYILCSPLIQRELYIYTKQNQINIPVFSILSDSIDWIAEEYNKTYYFVLHPNMRISHIYFPDKQYPELNKIYLEGVKRLLTEWSNDNIMEDKHNDHDCSDHCDHD